MGVSSLAPRVLTAEEFVQQTTPDQRAMLRSTLSSTAWAILCEGSALYLDRIGIFYWAQEDRAVNHDHENTILVQRVQVKKLCFEKCSELVSFQRERFDRLIETSVLCERVYAAIPVQHQRHWEPRYFSALIRTTLRLLREELVVEGYTRQLGNIGDLFAVHNRQGHSIEDWYAGCDIIVANPPEKVVQASHPKAYEAPVLESSWEPLSCAFGEPIGEFVVSIPHQLSSLGFDGEAIEKETSDHERSVAVAVFEGPSTSERKVYIYCTEGLRKLGYRSSPEGEKVGAELTVQVEDTNETGPELPRWPLRAIALGWALLRSSRGCFLRPGSGMSAELPLLLERPHFRTILSAPFEHLSYRQLCGEGAFWFVNITIVRDDEARFAEIHTPERLLALLRSRGYDQLSRPTRRSILGAAPVGAAEKTRARPSPESPSIGFAA